VVETDIPYDLTVSPTQATFWLQAMILHKVGKDKGQRGKLDNWFIAKKASGYPHPWVLVDPNYVYDSQEFRILNEEI
jgi:hypothetical protein